MKSIDIGEFCNFIDDGYGYDEICELFSIKTKEQFKRVLYDASVEKNKIIKFDFPRHKSSQNVVLRKGGFIKLSSAFVNEALKKMDVGTEVKLEVNYDVEQKQIVINVA